MMLKPAPFSIYQPVHFGLIRDFLALFLEKVVDVVSEEVIRDYVRFRSLGTLLARILNAVGVIIVLGGSRAEDALLLKSDQIVNIVRQLLQL